MQIIILAAGLGSRLGKGLPKALVSVCGKTMLQHQYEWTRAFNPERTIVIGGYCFPEMTAFCSKNFGDIILIENARYNEQNLYSLLAAENFFDKDTLIMNVDHIYPLTFAKRALEEFDRIKDYAIFADTDRQLSDDDMKVFINEKGEVEKISKKLESWNAGYIGMTFVRKDFWSKYIKAAAEVASSAKEKAVVEMVVQQLIDNGKRPSVINSDGIVWYEIDTPEELEFAEFQLKGNKN